MTFSGPGAQLLVRIYHQASIRRFAAGRMAEGRRKARNGVDDDMRPENLIVVKAGARPFDQGKGGKASSLERRAKTTTTLINALADHPEFRTTSASLDLVSSTASSGRCATCARIWTC